MSYGKMNVYPMFIVQKILVEHGLFDLDLETWNTKLLEALELGQCVQRITSI